MTIETTKIPPTMSGSRLKVLCALREAEEAKEALSMTELSKVAGVSTAAMTGVIDTLTRDGLAQRRRPGDDRRMQCVELTRAGLALVESMRARPSDGSGRSDTSEGKEAA